jgi:hypothetical protein
LIMQMLIIKKVTETLYWTNVKDLGLNVLIY